MSSERLCFISKEALLTVRRAWPQLFCGGKIDAWNGEEWTVTTAAIGLSKAHGCERRERGQKQGFRNKHDDSRWNCSVLEYQIALGTAATLWDSIDYAQRHHSDPRTRCDCASNRRLAYRKNWQSWRIMAVTLIGDLVTKETDNLQKGLAQHRLDSIRV